MANPRQRRKARSGNRGAKPTQNALRRLHNREHKKADIEGPEVLRKNWDKTKTVFQNYEALGLLSSIPVHTSAKVKGKTRMPNNSQSQIASTLDAELAEEQPKVVGYGRIIRDEDGNVIDVILPDEDEGGGNQVQQGDNDERKERAPVQGKTSVVKDLEMISSTSAPVKRHSSTSEYDWLLSLIDVYGDDTEAMSKDLKRNVWQRTKGQIGRMIRKAGGIEKLQQDLRSRTAEPMDL